MICNRYVDRIPGGRAADQLHQELQQLLGRAVADPARGREADRQAGGFIETDLVDPRYFSAANVKNRLESVLPDDQGQQRRNGRDAGS